MSSSKALTAKVKTGNIHLHITKFNDMKTDKWLEYFKTEEMVTEALEGEGTCIYKLPQISCESGFSDTSNLAITALKAWRASGCKPEQSVQWELNVPEAHEALEVQTGRKEGVLPPSDGTIRFDRPDVIHTNNGQFKSLGILKKNMAKMFNYEGLDLDGIFKSELTDDKISYLSEPYYTLFIRKVKARIERSQISILGGESPEEVEVEADDLGCMGNHGTHEEVLPTGLLAGKAYRLATGASPYVVEAVEVPEVVEVPEKEKPYGWVEIGDTNKVLLPYKFSTWKKAQKEAKMWNKECNKADPKVKAVKIVNLNKK